jgi:hypothetical protein
MHIRVSTLSDTVGESFELNIIAAQETGTLIGMVRPIAIDQGSMPGKLNFGHCRTPQAGSYFPVCSFAIRLK